MNDLISHISILNEFSNQQILATVLIFIWTGFVRSGLGFGGAALGLPLTLMVNDSLLFWLPIVGFHLLFFTSLTIYKRLKNVDWGYLKQALRFILPAKLIGVFGLLTLPNHFLIIMIYGITFLYAIMWIGNIKIKSKSGWGDKSLLVVGGYVSGTSLTGAPLIVAVLIQHIKKAQLRDTLFVMWFILVSIKLSTLAFLSVDLQIYNAILLMPAAWLGHLIGLKAHDIILQNDQIFRRTTGGVLLVICLLGVANFYLT